jgi:hypothetical protein
VIFIVLLFLPLSWLASAVKDLQHIIHVYALDGEIQNVELTPPEVQTILDQFPEVFGAPVGLPPTRACDHCIPLIPEAQPVKL